MGLLRVVGIDPGITGACCLLEEGDGRTIEHLDFLDMPTIGQDAQKHVDETTLAAWLREARPDRVWLELVSAMPSQSVDDGQGGKTNRRGMGATSAFHFGDTVATIRTTIRLCKFPLERVTPAKWKRFYGLKGPDKELSRQRALFLMPAAAEFMGRKKDHARAEALLIARWGAMILRTEAGAPAEKPMAPVPVEEVPE